MGAVVVSVLNDVVVVRVVCWNTACVGDCFHKGLDVYRGFHAICEVHDLAVRLIVYMCVEFSKCATEVAFPALTFVCRVPERALHGRVRAYKGMRRPSRIGVGGTASIRARELAKLLCNLICQQTCSA